MQFLLESVICVSFVDGFKNILLVHIGYRWVNIWLLNYSFAWMVLIQTAYTQIPFHLPLFKGIENKHTCFILRNCLPRIGPKLVFHPSIVLTSFFSKTKIFNGFLKSLIQSCPKWHSLIVLLLSSYIKDSSDDVNHGRSQDTDSETLHLWGCFPLEAHSTCIIDIFYLEAISKSPEADIIISLFTVMCSHYTHPGIFVKLIHVNPQERENYISTGK